MSPAKQRKGEKGREERGGREREEGKEGGVKEGEIFSLGGGKSNHATYNG